MGKGSGGTRHSGMFKNDKYLNDIFHSNNYEINAILRGVRYDEQRVLTDSEIKEVVGYVESAISFYGTEDGPAYRGLGFKTQAEMNAFIDNNINFTDNTYKDRGFQFVTTDELADVYTGAEYSVVIEFKKARYMKFDKIQPGYKNAAVIPRNEKFKISAVEPLDRVGHKLKIILS